MACLVLRPDGAISMVCCLVGTRGSSATSPLAPTGVPSRRMALITIKRCNASATPRHPNGSGPNTHEVQGASVALTTRELRGDPVPCRARLAGASSLTNADRILCSPNPCTTYARRWSNAQKCGMQLALLPPLACVIWCTRTVSAQAAMYCCCHRAEQTHVDFATRSASASACTAAFNRTCRSLRARSHRRQIQHLWVQLKHLATNG